MSRDKEIRDLRKTIDENYDYPLPEERKEILKYSPQVYQAYFGRKYILPQYRTKDYFKQEFLNYTEWAGVNYFPLADPKDETLRTAFVCSAIALGLKRPQLFLEPELGEVLAISPLPTDMISGDIKWKWPGFRVFLPRGLITIQREGYEHSLMYLDIAHLEEKGISVPPQFAREFDRYLDYMLEKEIVLGSALKNFDSFLDFHFFYKDTAIVLSGMVEKGPTNAGMTTYGLVKPFNQLTLLDLTKINDELQSEWPQDDLDRVFLRKMELLGLQILLFLSAYPLEVESETVLRRPRLEGKHPIPGLYPAKFVGQSQIRPQPGEAHHIASVAGVTGGHLKKHWKCGHWKRQVYGPKGTERKLIWIGPYQAGLLDETQL